MNKNREELFYANLDIKEEDKERARKNLISKGVEKHILIKEKISIPFPGEKVKYTQVASTYRYDKRIRMVLFKYLSYLEEFYRGILLDKYHNNFNVTKTIIWEDKISILFGKKDLNYILEKTDFKTLITQIQKINQDKNIKVYKWPKNKYVDNNVNTLIALRNAVMHNKFLLLFGGFGIYEKNDGTTISGLEGSILNLQEFLPNESIKNKLMEDIQKCVENRNEKDDTEWDLPEALVLAFDKEYTNAKIN